jgi:hypothetical protein
MLFSGKSVFFVILPQFYSVLIIKLFFVGVMVFKATFNNISVILLWSVLLLEETGVPGENHQPIEYTLSERDSNSQC